MKRYCPVCKKKTRFYLIGAPFYWYSDILSIKIVCSKCGYQTIRHLKKGGKK